VFSVALLVVVCTCQGSIAIFCLCVLFNTPLASATTILSVAAPLVSVLTLTSPSTSNNVVGADGILPIFTLPLLLIDILSTLVLEPEGVVRKLIRVGKLFADKAPSACILILTTVTKSVPSNS